MSENTGFNEKDLEKNVIRESDHPDKESFEKAILESPFMKSLQESLKDNDNKE